MPSSSVNITGRSLTCTLRIANGIFGPVLALAKTNNVSVAETLLANAGLLLIGLSILLLVGLKAKMNGAPVAILSILDIPSFFGDILSYIRLTAYAVGTSGIALAVNFLVTLAAGIPYVGVIIAILVFIVGHSFNIGMNFLGAFINAMRLHFLEFFKKFYEGGGTIYEPFKLKEQ